MMLWFLIGFMLIISCFFIAWPLWFTNKKMLLALVAFIFIGGLMLYAYFGQSADYFQYIKKQKTDQIAQADIHKIKNPKIIINQLVSHLKQDPSSAEGWYLLGKLYFSENNFQFALNSFSKAYHLKPEELNYSLNYLQANMIIHQRLNNQDEKLLELIVKQNPTNPEALNLLAMNYYLTRHYSDAVKTWEKLLPLFPAGSNMQHQILEMIAKAQRE